MDLDFLRNNRTRKAMSNEEAELYHAVIKASKSQTVVECGTYLGWSTCWAAHALNEIEAKGKVYSFDIQDRVGQLIFEGSDLEERIEHVVGDFRFFGTYVDGSIELIHPVTFLIDGSHSYGDNMDFWISIRGAMKRGDMVLLHDTATDKGTSQLATNLAQHYAWNVVKFPGGGLGITLVNWR